MIHVYTLDPLQLSRYITTEQKHVDQEFRVSTVVGGGSRSGGVHGEGVDAATMYITATFGPPAALPDDDGEGVERRRRGGASRRHCSSRSDGLGFVEWGCVHGELRLVCLRPPLLFL